VQQVSRSGIFRLEPRETPPLKRREFITLLGGAAGTWPLAAWAQQSDRDRLIGELIGFADGDPIGQALHTSFRAGLTKLGWVEGKNLRIESRWGGADPDRISRLATRPLVMWWTAPAPGDESP